MAEENKTKSQAELLATELGFLTFEIAELNEILRAKQRRANNVATALKEVKKNGG